MKIAIEFEIETDSLIKEFLKGFLEKASGTKINTERIITDLVRLLDILNKFKEDKKA